MANQVNKTIKVAVEVDGEKKLLNLKTAIELTEASLKRQEEIYKRTSGAVKRDTEKRIEEQTKYLEGLREQLKTQQQLDRFNEELDRKAKARELQQDLRQRRAAIKERRAVQDFWQSPSLRGAYKQFVSPTTKLRRELAEQRAIEDEMTALSVTGESEEVRAGAAVKAAAAGKAGKAAAGKLAGITAASMVVQGIIKIAKTVRDTFSKVLGQSLSIRANFNEIADNTAKMTDMYRGMVTYSAGSLTVNRQARETQMRYGMTGSQAWAFTQAKTMLGVSSDEDLYYMTARQTAVFTQYMQKQEEWYSKLESSGALENIQAMQLDLKLFKQEMSVDFLQWMADNKDTILTVAKTGLDVLKGLLQVLGKIFTLFGIDYSSNTYGFTSTAMSDAASITTNNANRSVNVRMTNNVNGVFNQPEMEQFLNERLNETFHTAAVALS